jgi:hypothetical protein
MRDLGDEDAKLQSCKTARPGMKISGKEDDAVMGLITGWWQEELAEDRCWAVVEGPGKTKLLVHYENRPAGDYHAVCAAFKHQGSGCAWPCLWCQVRSCSGGGRRCKHCERYSCQHTAFTGIHTSIFPLKQVDADQLGPEPGHYAASVESSREGLQPRRKQQPHVAQKAANAQTKAAGGVQAGVGYQGKKRTRPACQPCGEPAKRSAKPSPLDPAVPVYVHPHITSDGKHTLRLPPPAAPRTMESFWTSGELASRFGCYLPTAAKGKTYTYAEVNPDLLQTGVLKDTGDKDFLQQQCTKILLQDGIIVCVPAGGYADTHGNPWVFPNHRGDSATNGPGWESYLRYCRKGLTGMPTTDVFDIAELKPEALHAVIKTAALLSDLGETLALLCPVPFDLGAKLHLLWGWYKPQSGYDASTAATWARNVHTWGKLLEPHTEAAAYIRAVQCMSTMLSEAMHRKPNVQAFRDAAKEYHQTMLTHFPKVTLRIYKHALLNHVPDLISEGTLLDGSSWFLEAYNKVWKHQLLSHSNEGGGVHAESGVAANERKSEAGRARLQAERSAREDLIALKARWACSHPRIRNYAAAWGEEKMEETMRRAFQG